MDFAFQQSTLEYLKSLADNDIHSIIISGISGSGKTYCAKQFSIYKNIDTFNIVSAKASDLKETIDLSYSVNEPQVVCIENLDKGTVASSQVILKYLEEPLPYVYIIVTCNNISRLPATIKSRCTIVNLDIPDYEDLANFGKYINSDKFNMLQKFSLKYCIKSLSDISTILNMSLDNIQYYDIFATSELWKQTTDQIVWQLNHYKDNSKCNPLYSVLIIYNCCKDFKVKEISLQTLLELEHGLISESAILNKFVLKVKYRRQ